MLKEMVLFTQALLNISQQEGCDPLLREPSLHAAVGYSSFSFIYSAGKFRYLVLLNKIRVRDVKNK